MALGVGDRPTTADLSGIGQRAFRDRLRTALGEIGPDIPESEDFWKVFTSKLAPASQERTLVLADLADLIYRFRSWSVHDWTASVRRTQPYFLAFVRTQRDLRCAALVDDLLRASDMRLSVCNDWSDQKMLAACLNAGLSGIKADGLLEVRHLPELDRIWVHFGDGFAGLLDLEVLGAGVKQRLVPESATVSPFNTAIELVTRDGDLFEIDSAAARGILDEPFARSLKKAESEHDATFGARIRKAREAAGLTQPELGALTGFDQAVISRIERGKVRPRIDTLEKLAEGLSIPVSEMLSA